MFSDYLPLTQGVPYIVSFPGSRYYEFDLSSEFYKTTIGNATPQTVTFSAYGPDRSDVRNYAQQVQVPVTDVMQTSVSTQSMDYAHTGTFIAKSNAQYSINADGTAFESTGANVLPFRTYMTASSAMTRAIADERIIYIGGENIDVQPEPIYPEETEKLTGNYVKVYPIGKGRIVVESTYQTALTVHTMAGQLYRLLDVRPGVTTYSGFPAGIYIFGTTKLLVK